MTDQNQIPGSGENIPVVPLPGTEPVSRPIPVFVNGRPVFRTIQLFDAKGNPILKDGHPVYRYVQRFIRDGRHVYLSMNEFRSPSGETYYLPGDEEFAVESDLPVTPRTVQPYSGVSGSYSPSSAGRLSTVLTPEITDDLRISSAYKRAGLGITAVSLIMTSVSSVILVFGVYVLFILSGLTSGGSGGISELFNGNVNQMMKAILDTPSVWVLSLIIALSSGIGLCLGIVAERLILSNRHYEPVQKQSMSFGTFMMFVIVALGVWSLGVFIGNFAAIFFPLETSTDVIGDLENIGPASLPIQIYALIGAPVLEEIACRKLLLDRLHKYGQLPAAIVSGLLFGLLHGNSAQFFLAAFLGFIFAIVYMKTGRVIYTMILHFIINLSATVPTFLDWGGVNVSFLFTFVFLPLVFVAGFVVMIVNRRRIFSITFSVSERPSRQVYLNPGMIIAIAGGVGMIYVSDFLSDVIPAMQTGNLLHLVCLFSMAAVPAVVIAAIVLTGLKPRNVDESIQEPSFETPEL